MLVDIVSKNGNLLLDIGPEADGTIPAVQLGRLKILGQWMVQNGEAIYGTRPWNRAEGETTGGIPVRFTSKGPQVYAVLLGIPKSGSVTRTSVRPNEGSEIYLLGYTRPLAWRQQGEDVQIDLPSAPAGEYALALRFTGGGKP